MARPLLERFWDSVEITDFCWNWTGSTYGDKRYGRFQLTCDVVMAAHRFAWELHSGQEIPSGMCICHTCDNTRCVRPDHLFIGTMKDNMRDASNKKRFFNQRRTHCKRGHLFSLENTYIAPDGRRGCRTCMAARENKQWRQAYYTRTREKILARMKTYYQRRKQEEVD